MPVSATASSDGAVVTITVSGRFDFNVHRQFRAAYEPHKQPGTSFVVDLGGTDYMDSSALGTLLLLREHAGGETATVSLKNCRPAIAKILRIANFQNLFTVEEVAA